MTRPRPPPLWRIGHVLGTFDMQVRAARVETLGAEAVDVFYVVDAEGRTITDGALRASIRAGILEAVR
jgi:[protein-PII] uridylyltransferase